MDDVENLRQALRSSFLYVLLLFFFCIDTAFIPAFLPLGMKLDLLLAGFFFLSLFSPHNVALYVAAFFLGALKDFIADSPLGLHILVYGGVVWFAQWQYRYLKAQKFVVFWLAFVLIAALAFLFKWLVYVLYLTVLLPLSPALSSFIFTILFFPPVFFLMHRILTLFKNNVNNEA